MLRFPATSVLVVYVRLWRVCYCSTFRKDRNIQHLDGPFQRPLILRQYMSTTKPPMPYVYERLIAVHNLMGRLNYAHSAESKHKKNTAKSSIGIVPPSSLCPPRWSGAGVGVRMMRSAGDSLTWKYKNYKIPISCVLTDTKFISKLLKLSLQSYPSILVQLF